MRREIRALASCAALAALALAACGGGGGESGDPTLPSLPQPPSLPPGSVNPPVIASFAPTAGGVGTQVVVSGINFATTASENSVRFNGVDAAVTSASANQLVALVPVGATSGPLQITTAGGTATSSGSFTVLSGTAANWTTRTFGSHITLALSSGIAHNGTRFVSVGTGAFEASTDALVWTATSSSSSAADVAWNGQSFVAVGNSFFVHTSTDGLTWAMHLLPNGNSFDLHAVAASPAIWVAVGEAGAIFSSPDGITWTARTSGTAKNLVDVTWAASRFVAVGADGAVVTSPDGIEWTLQVPPTTDSFTAVGASSSLIVAATFPYAGSQLKLLSSPDGVTWTDAATDLAAFNEIVYAGGRFVAAGYYETATSIDGVVWTSSAQLPGILDSVVYVNNQYVAIGSDGGSTGAIFTSPDGLNWKIVQSAHALRRVARDPANGRLVAVGPSHITRASTDNGATWTLAPHTPSITDNYPFLDLVWSPSAAAFIGHVEVAANQRAYSSLDGATWTQLGHMPCHGALAASPTRMVNVGFSLVGACVSVSTDGAVWAAVTPIPSTAMTGVFWTGSQFVGVGSNGFIATSADGLAWIPRSSGVSASLTGGTTSASLIVVIGASGTLVTSSDGGVNWTIRSSGSSSSLRRAIHTGTEFLVVTAAGTLLRSANGTSWSSQPTGYTVDLGDIVSMPDNSRLVLVGPRGLVATSP